MRTSAHVRGGVSSLPLTVPNSTDPPPEAHSNRSSHKRATALELALSPAANLVGTSPTNPHHELAWRSRPVGPEQRTGIGLVGAARTRVEVLNRANAGTMSLYLDCGWKGEKISH